MYTKKFNEIGKDDVSLAGGKGASLGEMTQVGIPVPPGFIVLSESFDTFLSETGLLPEIDSILHSVDHNVVHTVDGASEKIRAMIEGEDIPESIILEIKKAFTELDAEFVAVRSSATSEDSADAAWAGQLETFLNTKEDQLIEHVKKCWSSLFTSRAIFYRFEQGLHGTPISVAVVVQKMVNSEKAGIAFSVHPVTQDPNQLIVEAGFGLGESIVSGQVTPDSYVVEKDTELILERKVNTQKKELVRDANGENAWNDLGEKGAQVILDDEAIMKVSLLVKRIEDHYSFPVDIEWAYEKGDYYITQSRPITTLRKDTLQKTGPNYEKIISRNIPPFGWSGGARYEHDGLVIGPVHWMRNREIIVKNNTEQAHVFFDTNEFCVTNVLREVSEINHDFEKALDKSIEWIDDVMQVVPAETKPELESLIEMHDKSFGIMLMALDLVNELGEFIPDHLEMSPELSQLIFSPIKPTLIQRENAAMVEARKFIDEKSDQASDILLGLADEFGFIHQDYMGKVWDFKDYEKAIKKTHKKQDEQENVSTENLSEYAKWLIDVIRKSVYVYEEGRNAMVRAVWAILNSEAVHGLDHTLLLHMTSKEFLVFLKTDELQNKKEILHRQKYFALSFDSSDIEMVSDKDSVERIIKENKLDLCVEVDGTEMIKGSVAHKGIVEGRVRLVFTQKDAAKVEEGEVIVSPMTAVEFLSGIRKAAAIVTDEGGIICHAAIVSRELNIPCVIGTTIATSVLKTGDKVRVDANKGEIRIIK